MIDDFVSLLDDENLLGIPEKTAEEGQREHSGGGNGGRATEDHKWENENTRIIPNGNRWDELLHDAAQQKKANQTDGVEKHVQLLITG